MRERNSFTYLFLRTIVYAVLLSAVALGQIRIQKSIRINPGISTDDAPPTRLHYNGYLHDLYVEFTITPADPNFQPLLWLWMRPEWTDDYGMIIPGQMDACEEYRPQLNTYVEEYLGQGYFAVAPEHGGGNPTNYPYTLSWRAFVDGKKIYGIGMNGDSLICDSANFDVYYDYYDNGMPCHSFWNVCWEFYIFNLSTFDKPLTDRITQGKVNEIRFDGEVIDHRVSTPPPYWCPVVDPVTATIIKGDKYAHLCTETDTASQITGLAYQEALYLEVDRDIPDTADQYCVVQTSTRNFTRTDTVYYLPHDTLFVTCEPKQLYTGDTAIIHIHQRFDGVVDTNEYFQSREIGILGNDYYGTLLDEWGDTATYFQNVTGQLWFIAAQDLDADSVCAQIRVGLAPSLPMCSVVPMGTVPNRSVPMGIVSKGPVPLGALHSGPVLLAKKGKKPTLAFSGKKKYRQIMNELFKQETKNTFTEGTKPKDAAIVKSVKQGKRARPESLIKKSGKIKDIQFQYTQAGSDSIPIKSRDILLGQTKYYWATEDPDDDSKLIIQESETDPGNSIPPGIVDVNFTVTKNANDDKLGVYYEYKNDKGNDLGRNWFIRIIGRYWAPAKTYKAHLYATTLDGTRSGDISIEVKKPVRLFTPDQTSLDTFNLSRDVFDHEINIDDTCCFYGGKYGIPPQFLKGQMVKEAGHKNFGTYTGLAPSYRYEPFSKYAQLSKAWKESSKYNIGLWVVDPNRTGHEMGTGKDVPVHHNVCYMDYPRSPKTVWDILWDHSELVNMSSGKNDIQHRIYGSRVNGIMVFPYDDISEKYNEFLRNAYIYSILNSTQSVEDIARGDMIVFLRDKWNGGTKKMIAQTRLASSYGLLQMMYDRAVRDAGYPCKDANISPEDFNVTETNMIYSMKYMKKILLNVLTPAVEENGQWPNGFENWFKNYVWRIWNTGTTQKGYGYSNDVYSNSQKYLPQDK